MARFRLNRAASYQWKSKTTGRLYSFVGRDFVVVENANDIQHLRGMPDRFEEVPEEEKVVNQGVRPRDGRRRGPLSKATLRVPKDVEVPPSPPSKPNPMLSAMESQKREQAKKDAEARAEALRKAEESGEEAPAEKAADADEKSERPETVKKVSSKKKKRRKRSKKSSEGDSAPEDNDLIDKIDENGNPVESDEKSDD